MRLDFCLMVTATNRMQNYAIRLLCVKYYKRSDGVKLSKLCVVKVYTVEFRTGGSVGHERNYKSFNEVIVLQVLLASLQILKIST
jgi:hypothetical protein